MSLSAAVDNNETLLQHGIDIGIQAYLLEVQQLAVVVSLHNRYRVRVMYEGLDHVFHVDIYRRHSVKEIWCCTRSMAAALPNQSSDEEQHAIAIKDLEGITEVLEQLLQEGLS